MILSMMSVVILLLALFICNVTAEDPPHCFPNGGLSGNLCEVYRKQMAAKCEGDSCSYGTHIKSQYYFADLAMANNLTGTFVELGVNFGGFAHFNLHRWKGDTYVMIDPFPRKERNKIVQKYKDANRKLVHYQTSDKKVVESFPDGSIDILYVDARHTYLPVVAYIERWWPKIKPGGILCGDDFVATQEGLTKFYHDAKISGPWIGMCKSPPDWDEKSKASIDALCEEWGMTKEEHNAAGGGGTVRAVVEFSRRIKQHIGVTLDGRTIDNIFPITTGNGKWPEPFPDSGAYYPKCEFETCYLDNKAFVNKGEPYFNPSGWYVVKPLTED